MSAPDTPAFRISSAAAASPPNPPPTICARMSLLPGLDGGKAARRRAFAPARHFTSEAYWQVVAAYLRLKPRNDASRSVRPLKRELRQQLAPSPPLPRKRGREPTARVARVWINLTARALDRFFEYLE